MGKLRWSWLGSALLCFAMPSFAGAQDAGAKERLYPEILLETDASFSDDAGLMDFRIRLASATKMLVETPEGRVSDPAAMLPLMASSVEVLVGGRYEGTVLPTEEWPAKIAEFRSLGSLAPLDALEAVGRWRQADAPSAVVAQRYGMRAIDQLLWDHVIGATPWLDGRICTASYGRMSDRAFESLVRETGFSADRWIISVPATTSKPPANPHDPFLEKSFQILPKSAMSRRDGGWMAVLTPSGETVQVRDWPWEPHFAPYLNSHLCFAHQAEGWKLDAVALRLE